MNIKILGVGVEGFSHQLHSPANKHLKKAILDTNKLFILKGNHNSTDLPMHIHKLIYHCNDIHKQTDQIHKSLLLTLT